MKTQKEIKCLYFEIQKKKMAITMRTHINGKQIPLFDLAFMIHK
jgi:hypothetical protein